MSRSNKGGTKVQATRSFVTYVAGDCVSASGGQMLFLPAANAKELVSAGYAVPADKAMQQEEEVHGIGRVVSDVVPDPIDITDEEKAGTRDVPSGRDYVDPSIRRAREGTDGQDESHVQTDSAGKRPRARRNAQSDAVQEPVVNNPEGSHTDSAQDGEAAKGAATTGKRDVSKGPKPASQPVKTGQTTAKRKPRASGQGKVAAKDPDIEEPDRSTVGDSAPKVEQTGPNRDEPDAPHPSPGTVDVPDSH